MLATKTNKTIIKEKDGANFTKRRDQGPPISGDFGVDSNAFVDAIIEIIDPPKTVDADRGYK